MTSQKYKEQFNRLYEESSPEIRSLFDKNGELVPKLHVAWNKYQKALDEEKNEKADLDLRRTDDNIETRVDWSFRD